jgi:hypothetical protein
MVTFLSSQSDRSWQNRSIANRSSRHREDTMARIESKLAALGLVLPAPLKAPPGTVLPFAMVRIVGRRAVVSGTAR